MIDFLFKLPAILPFEKIVQWLQLLFLRKNYFQKKLFSLIVSVDWCWSMDCYRDQLSLIFLNFNYFNIYFLKRWIKRNKISKKRSFFKILFIYLFDRKTAQGGGAAEGEGKAGSPLHREPDVGLDPKTPGPRPEPKADAQPTKPPRCPPKIDFFYVV